MFYRRKLSALLILFIVAFLFSSVHCKKQSCTPDADSLTRPVIWLNLFNLSFSAYEKGPNPASQILKIKNSGIQTLDYILSTDADWVRFTPDGGTSSGQINEHTIFIDKTGLKAQDQEYTAKITVTSSQAYNNPQEVTVNLELNEEPPAEIWVSTKNLTFSAQVGGANPPSQTLKIMNSGEGVLRYNISTDASWFEVNPSSGKSEGGKRSHSVIVDIAGLNEGTYDGMITIADSAASNSPQNVKVNLNITKEPPPEILTDPNTLSFDAEVGGGNPSSQAFFIANSGGGTLNYNIAWDAPWLSVNPASGSTDGPTRQHNASVNIGGMSAGNYQGTITVTAPNASNSPQTIGVTLHISTPSINNEVGISISPSSGGVGDIVSITIFIDGNTSLIEAFGLNLHYNESIFQYVNTSTGTLTSSWGSNVAGNASSGIIIVGGYKGGSAAIPIGSQGSIAVVTLRVTGGSGPTTITMDNLFDDISGMGVNPSSVTFIKK